MHAIQTSGNCMRNTTTDQFAGVAADELLDSFVWCELIRQWSTFRPEFNWLPCKFKIAANGVSVGDAAGITRTLLDRGRSPHTPVASVEAPSLPDQQFAAGRLVSLPDRAGRLGMGPATILLGEVFAETAVRAARTAPGAAAATAWRSGTRAQGREARYSE